MTAMDQVAEIKSKIDIASLINERVPLKQRGRRFIALCPFHSEKTPSFTVSPELGIFKCFGCGASGDVFSFLEKYEGMNFVEALEYLAQKAGVKLERRHIDRHQNQIDKKIFEANHLAAEYYHYLLTKHKVGERARDYLKNRQIREPAIENFFLGYSLNRWDGLYKFLTKKGYEPELLESAGLIVRSQPSTSGINHQSLAISHYYDRFRGRLIFPLRDVRGQIVGLAGRLLDGKVYPEESRRGAKYINSPETPVYHKGQHLYGIFENRADVHKSDRAVLVEGEIDAISSWQAGVRNVLAVKGTALTPEQVKLVRRFTRNITMSLDSDSAGWEALKRSLPILENHNINIRIAVTPPEFKDPDEMALQDSSAWKKLIDTAPGIYQAFIDQAILRIGCQTGEQKKTISELIIPLLSEIENAIEQDHWIKYLAQKLNVNESSIRRQIAVHTNRQKNSLSSPIPADHPDSSAVAAALKGHHQSDILSLYLLSLIIQSRRPLKSLLPKPYSLNSDWLTPLGSRKIAALFKKSPKISLDSLPSELKELFISAATRELGPTPDAVDDPGWIEKEIISTLKKLERFWLKNQIQKYKSDPAKIKEFTLRLNQLEK